MTVVAITLPGPPRTKKNSANITMVGKRKIVKPSAAWLRWRDQVRKWFLEQPAIARRGFPLPVAEYNCSALIYRDAARGDAVGYYQGVADVLEEIGVVTDDVQFTQWDGSHLLLDRTNPRVEITITPTLTGNEE